MSICNIPCKDISSSSDGLVDLLQLICNLGLGYDCDGPDGARVIFVLLDDGAAEGST